MTNFSKAPISKRIKLLLVGEPGAGKTGQLATLANAGFNVRVINFDGNLSIINSYINDDAKSRLDYTYIPARDLRAWDAGVTLTKHWKVADQDLGPITSWTDKDILVIDTISFWTDACLRKVLQENKKDIDAAAFDQSLYGVMAARVENEISRLAGDDIKAHLILNAHLRILQKKDGQGIEKLYGNMAGQKLLTVVPAYMNNVWSIEKRGDKKMFITQSTNKMSLKCSTPKLLKPEEDFDLGKLFLKMTQ